MRDINTALPSPMLVRLSVRIFAGISTKFPPIPVDFFIIDASTPGGHGAAGRRIATPVGDREWLSALSLAGCMRATEAEGRVGGVGDGLIGWQR